MDGIKIAFIISRVNGSFSNKIFPDVYIKKRPSLGKPIATYRRAPLNWAGFFLLSSLGGVTILIPLFYGFKNYLYAYTNHGPIAAIYWSRTWYLLSILNLIIYCIVIAVIRANTRRKIILHQHGLLVNYHSNQEIYWDQIFGIGHGIIQPSFLNIRLPERNFAMLYLNDGTKIKIDPLVIDLNLLISQIKNQVLPIIAPFIEKDFTDGKWLEFGSIQLNNKEIRILGRDISWSNIKNLVVQDGYLVVGLTNKPNIYIQINKIPNIELVLRIAKAGVKI